MSDQPHVLYRFFGAGNALLYVGLTRDPGSRITKHAGTKEWWPEVRQVTFEHYPSKEAVRKAEEKAIHTEYPRYNIMLKNGASKLTAEQIQTSREDSFDGLVGRWFHSDGKDGWQGQIIDRQSDELLVVQLYSWLDGCPSTQILLPATDMLGWKFYPTADHMQASLGCLDSECKGLRPVSYRTEDGRLVCSRCAKSYRSVEPLVLA